MIHISKGLEPLWDTYLIDSRFTDAELSGNRPEKRGTVFCCDKPWEGRASGYFSILKDDDIYRMYYIVTSANPDKVVQRENLPKEDTFVCYAESKDGVNWERPSLGIYNYKGSTENNILFGPDDYYLWDNFYAMKDENPTCPTNMRYKAVASRYEGEEYGLMSFISSDGVHFTKNGFISQDGTYDSVNTLHWNANTGKYHLYYRCFHEKYDDPNSTFNESNARGIMYAESTDFVNWTPAKQPDYQGAENYPLYTNCVSLYPYDKRYFIGFPTRYVERRNWTANYDRLCGREERLGRIEYFKKLLPGEEPTRAGLVITDCVFMSSRDGYHWHRFDEACILPGPESGLNWLYGDGYPACGLIETPSRFEGEPAEMTQLVTISRPDHLEEGKGGLVQYVWRRDGFASYKAGYMKKRILTKPFTFDGETLSMNFRTSARGGIYVRVLAEDSNPIDGYASCEIFGDALDRVIDFDKPLAELHGKVVRLEFVMSDAEIYALRFS